MKVNVPDELIAGIPVGESSLLFELALGLYVDGKATLGQAARLASMSRPSFLDALGQRRIPVNYDEDDLESDIGQICDLETNPVADED